ncbi:MAG: GAF domain-containing protein [Ignavibacteria bacterium]
MLNKKFSIPETISLEEKYRLLIEQAVNLVKSESNLIANLANISAVLYYSFDYFCWVGFYLLESDDELVLGPFQGKIACTRLKVGKGVCGTAVLKKETIIVPDVTKFEGHIYCDPDTKSEIVIPIGLNDKIIAVLDIDSYKLNAFSKVDKFYLELLIEKINFIFEKKKI